jgi:hypothetical protein
MSKRNGLLLAGAALALALAQPAVAQAASWSAPVDVPGSSSGSVSDVAISPNGTVAVAWDAGLVRVRTPKGKWHSLARLAARTSTSTSPDIAFDSHNVLIATWTQAGSAPGKPLKGPFTVRANTWSERIGWGNVRVLGRSLHFTLAQPKLALNAKGDAVVSWRGFRRMSSSRVVESVATSVRPAGGRFGAEQKVGDGGPYQDVAIDDRGDLYAVWTTYGGPVNRFAYKPSGKRWGAPLTLSSPMSSNPTIAVTPDRTAVVAWRAADVDSEGDGIQYGAVYTAVRSPAGVFGMSEKLSDARVHDVHLAVSPAGDTLISWGAPDLGDPTAPGAVDLRFSIRAAGDGISAERRMPGLREGPSAYLADGTALLAFGLSNTVQVAAMAPGSGTFATPQTIAMRGLYPSLSVAGNRAAISWLDPARTRVVLSVLENR